MGSVVGNWTFHYHSHQLQSIAVGQAVACTPVTQRAQVWSRSGQVSWVRFFRGFSSLVKQMSGSFRPPKSPNIIWPYTRWTDQNATMLQGNQSATSPYLLWGFMVPLTLDEIPLPSDFSIVFTFSELKCMSSFMSYSKEQRIFICNTFMKRSSWRQCLRKFRHQFPDSPCAG